MIHYSLVHKRYMIQLEYCPSLIFLFLWKITSDEFYKFISKKAFNLS